MSQNTNPFVHYAIVWPLVLFAFWLLLSGFFKPLLLGLGVVSVVIVVALLYKMDKHDEQIQPLPLSPRFFAYVGWLLVQVFKSGIQVTKLVWTRGKTVEPTLATLSIKDKSVNTRVLYANSVTLTPGTLCIDIDDENVTVHALQHKSVEQLDKGEMARRVANVNKEGESS
ncbi:MAG: Na+/H+ antiporter subunit E [Psychrobium sp.]